MTIDKLSRFLTIDEYIDALLRDRERIADDLRGPCRDQMWRQDRIDALAWTNRELIRLGWQPE